MSENQAQTTAAAEREARIGLLYGLAAFGTWGFVAVYFKAVDQVPALELLAHRISWSVPVLLLLLLWRRQVGATREALRSTRVRWTLVASTLLVSINWFTFIYAVVSSNILQASLGYYINPLVNVLLGFLFLGERLRRPQQLAVLLATLGVAAMAVVGGVMPWLSLLLAFSFGSYGLLRKKVAIGALGGLLVETLLVLPLTGGYLLWLAARGESGFGQHGLGVDLLLLGGGVITAVPLLWFNEAARRLRYATVGFLQYIAPSLQFLVAVAFFGELFTPAHAVGFGCIWVALALYSVDSWRQGQQRRRARRAAAAVRAA